jgi:formylglycine-generating enzyme required for sulfatase activity
MLCGELPFRGSKLMILHQVLSEEPRPPRKLNDKIPKDLETICLKCLEKQPAKRYPTARALAEELRRFLDNRPILARPVGRLEQGVKWVKRRPGVSALLATLAAVLVAALGVVSWQLGETRAALKEKEDEQKERVKAETQRSLARVAALQTATPGAVPAILADLEAARDDVLPRLRELWHGADAGDPQARMRVGLALLPVEPEVVRDDLADWLLRADDPAEVVLVRDALTPHKDALRGRFWHKAEAARVKPEEQFRAQVALAAFDPGNERWAKQARAVVEQLLNANPLHLGSWEKAFQPVRGSLLKPLSEVFRTAKSAERREFAATVLADYAGDRLDVLADLLLDANPRQFAVLFPKVRAFASATVSLQEELAKRPPPDGKVGPDEPAREALAKRQANAAAALLRLGRAEEAWPLFRHSPDPTPRSELVARVAPLGIEARRIADRLLKEEEQDVSARRALIVALGEYNAEQLPVEVRQPLTATLLRWYGDDPDPGIHGAIDWLLRHGKEGPEARPLDWGQAAKLKAIDTERRRREPDGQRRWYVNGQGQTMVCVAGPVEFRMGSPLSEADRRADETPHRQRIGRSFAIASKSVTVAQWQRFGKAHPEVTHAYLKQYSPEEDCPISAVTWYEAAQYCRWLSEQEGIPEHQMVYPPVAVIEKSKDRKTPLRLPPDNLKRTGYRLPTEAESEYAARAGADTSRYYGSSLDLLPRYAWYYDNSAERAWPVGQKRPNDFGLFDAHGNVQNWTQESKSPYKVSRVGEVIQDVEDIKDITSRLSRSLRGGAFTAPAAVIRAAYRNDLLPWDRYSTLGLRPARTLP